MKKIDLVFLFNLIVCSFVIIHGSNNDATFVHAVPVLAQDIPSVSNSSQLSEVITKELLMNRITSESFVVAVQVGNNQVRRILEVPSYFQPEITTEYSALSSRQGNEEYENGMADIINFVNSKANQKNGPICINSDELPQIVKVIEDEAFQKGSKDGSQKSITRGLVMGTVLGAGIVGTCWLTSRLLEKKK